MTSLLQSDFQGEYEQESYEAMRRRYPGFGVGLFEQLQLRMPGVFAGLRFYYRSNSPFALDAFAICKGLQTEFAIQLDGDIEMICIWDTDSHIEIGDWYDQDPVTVALDYIRQHYLVMHSV
ncbi:hypothetical protein WH50_22050 [Pokkaliibacter plantistimulans]|uniref:Uncharacterized protein n=2 Tax=Pseudomonadota TaxID=1224 RepID=A0ABX5LR74_9GAMM|nr:hypothetical protein [Pokkaliibacter plantistimulans]PPC76877.1 hypothetical protein C4K68_13135 [Pokkaliibacter plantistimulans]PXF29170.1 hypothetical protein WH50_22050 [Pokkaliibacter plantistimulans]